LFFEHAVLETELLFFAEGDGVFALLLAAGADAVLAGWEVAALECFRGPKRETPKRRLIFARGPV
jgi:hypothetical protein